MIRLILNKLGHAEVIFSCYAGFRLNNSDPYGMCFFWNSNKYAYVSKIAINKGISVSETGIFHYFQLTANNWSKVSEFIEDICDYTLDFLVSDLFIEQLKRQSNEYSIEDDREYE